MANIEATPEMMNNIANDLGKKIEQWNTAVKAIYDMQAELDGIFEGAARESLKAMMERDRPSYNALSELLLLTKIRSLRLRQILRLQISRVQTFLSDVF